MTLERYSDLLEQRDGYKEKKQDSLVKSDVELEKEARQKVMKIMERNFDRLKVKFTDEERFNMFVNTITDYMDPHSNYFPPVEKRSFDEQMSGRFFGYRRFPEGGRGQYKK
jgi:carboxyl-terminal processing protease